MREQYSWSRAHTMDRRNKGYERAGQYPFNPMQMMANHPAMSMLDPEKQEEYVELAMTEVKPLFLKYGEAPELMLNALEDKGMPPETKLRADQRWETQPDRLAPFREKGQAVKSEINDP